MIIQTRALLLDAYRELNAKKMFWIVLILSVLVMAAFSVVGANDRTLTVLWFEPFGDIPQARLVYKGIYSYLVVGAWLTWIASLLALISTAGIFPDFLASGSVDLFLAKPISRLRLFFTKYLAGLLFVTLQVSLFALMSFLVLGVRAGLWQFGLFAAIPLVVIFFSYLFAICVFLGVLTRSTIAALLLTLLAWFGIFIVDYADRQIQGIAYLMAIQHDTLPDQIDEIDADIARLSPATAAATATASATATAATATPAPDAEYAPSRIDSLKRQREELVRQQDQPAVPHGLIVTKQVFFTIKSFVPKTRETIGLLDRVLFTDKDLQEASRQAPTQPQPGPRPLRRRREPTATMQFELDRQRSPWWIIGTSLAFEAVLLALAAWRFCTRDY